MSNERNSTIDVARGIGMLLVVYGHCLEVLFVDRPDHIFNEWSFTQYKAIYSFHMPLFFFLSGAAQSRLQAKTFSEVTFRSLTLLLFGFVIHEIGVLIVYFYRIENFSDWQLVKWTIRAIVEGCQFSIRVLWFVVALSVVQFLFWASVARKSLTVYVGLSLLTAASLFFYFHPDLLNIYQIKIWIPACVFFGLGWCLNRFSIAIPVLFGAPSFVGVFLLFKLNNGCTLDFSGSCPSPHLGGHFAVQLVQATTGNWLLFYVTALLGITGVLSLARAIHFHPLTWVGRNSLEIFIANGIVLEFMNPVIRSIPILHEVVDPILLIASTLIINILIFVILRSPIQLIYSASKKAANEVMRPGGHLVSYAASHLRK